MFDKCFIHLQAKAYFVTIDMLESKGGRGEADTLYQDEQKMLEYKIFTNTSKR